jgi:hypothetical protein
MQISVEQNSLQVAKQGPSVKPEPTGGGKGLISTTLPAFVSTITPETDWAALAVAGKKAACKWTV